MVALAAICMSGSAHAADAFTIRGFIPGVTDSLMITLSNAEREGGRPSRVYTTDGHFTFSDTVRMPSLCTLSIARRGGKFNFFRPFSSPRIMVENADMKITFTAGPDSLANSCVPELLMQVEGSRSHDEFVTYLDECLAAERKAGEAESMLTRKYFDTQADEDTSARYEMLQLMAEDELRDAQRRFIKEHPSFHISACLALKEMREPFSCSIEDMTALAESLKACPDSARLRQIRRTFERNKDYALGRMFIDFRSKDTAGAEKRLSDFVTPGRYTLIDFWASWCVPCRFAIPHVKGLSERYGDRLGVLSVSLDKDDAAWRKALDSEKMSWAQLNASDEYYDEVTKSYLIRSIPRFILLDGEGRIVCSTSRPATVDSYLAKNL